MRDVNSIVATATDLSYQDVKKSLAAISERLAEIPHTLLKERSKQDDLQLQLENIERDLVQLDLAATIGIDNSGKARAEQHLQDLVKKTKGKITSAKLEIDRIRSEKCHLEALHKELQAKTLRMEQAASIKKRAILQDQERAYLDNDVTGKALHALSDFLVYTSLRIGMQPTGINVANLVAQELQRDNGLTKLAEEKYQGIVARAIEVSYE